ncbi:MAG: retropepsin-like aspartic protease [Pseudomonadota bacterium]
MFRILAALLITALSAKTALAIERNVTISLRDPLSNHEILKNENLAEGEVEIIKAIEAQAAFDDEKALSLLRKMAQSQTAFKEQVWYLLARVAFRQGLYNEARKAFENYLTIKESKAVRQMLSFAQALKKQPAQKIEKYAASVVPLQKDKDDILYTPIKVEGIAENFIIDTGASFSVLSKSFAEKIDLKALPAKVDFDSIGTEGITTKLAVVRKVEIGNTVFSNVPFIIVDDAQLNIKKDDDIKGIIGLPLLSRLGRLEFRKVQGQKSAKYQLSFSESVKQEGFNNFIFDGFDQILYTKFMNKDIQLLFDTGAKETCMVLPYLYEKIGSQNIDLAFIKKLESTKLKKQKFAGVGSVAHRNMKYLSDVDMNIADQNVRMNRLGMIMGNDDTYRNIQGGIGQDVLWLYDGYVLDYGKMKFEFIKSGK